MAIDRERISTRFFQALFPLRWKPKNEWHIQNLQQAYGETRKDKEVKHLKAGVTVIQYAHS